MPRLRCTFLYVLIVLSAGFMLSLAGCRSADWSTSKRAPSAGAPITTLDLVREMIDLERLSRFPAPGYETFQFSSYDRSSVGPYLPGWFANNDGFGETKTPSFLKVLRPAGRDGLSTCLLAEVNGPGAIVRTWTPNPEPINGKIAVYLDGNKKPIYEGATEPFFRYRYDTLLGRPWDKREGFTQRDSCYFPIAFAKGLRIVWTGKLEVIHFYHVGVRQYPAGTPIKTFDPADLKTWSTQIEGVLDVLNKRGDSPQMRAAGEKIPFDLTLKPHAGAEQLVSGPGEIRELELRVEAADPARALRELVLTGFFDGSPNAQIEAPLGAFFASAPGLVCQETAALAVRRDGTMLCRFRMPFQYSARFHIENFGAQPARVRGTLTRGDYAWDPWRSMHFHATWRADHNITAGPEPEVMDMPFLVARGQGALVGTALMIMNPTPVVTIGGSWWGEGDEKIWLDDHPFPSFFGTGSEDFFNYSWSNNDLFNHAYGGQLLSTGPGSGGFVAVDRLNILDPILFRRHIDFYMELWHHSHTPGLSHARTVYFYAFPWLRDDHIRLKPDDVLYEPRQPEGWQPEGYFGGEEKDSIFFQAEQTLTEHPAGVRIEHGGMWAGGQLVQWSPRAEGETLTFALDLKTAGFYELMGTFAQTPRSGRVALVLDGGKTLDPVLDLYTPLYTLSRNFSFGKGTLAAGRHTFTLVARGHNPDSGGAGVGADFFWLIPRKK